MTALIEVQNVSKSFRHDWTFAQKHVLFDVSFSVQAGEAFGFVGPNGAGKTTTIKMLLDLIRPTRGTVKLFGQAPSDAKTRLRVGFLPERPYFYEHFTGRELLRFYADLSGVKRTQREARVEQMLALVELTASADKRLKTYSKGMLQRLGLAHALVGDPELVILDEPMSGLDPIGRRAVRDIILDLKKQGKTVFFSSHILPDIESICDRVAMIHGGRLRLVGDVRELLSKAKTNTSEVTIRLRDDKPECITHFSPVAGGLYQGLLTDEVLQTTLITLLQLGAEIISVVPKRGSLEDEFLKGIAETLASATAAPQVRT